VEGDVVDADLAPVPGVHAEGGQRAHVEVARDDALDPLVEATVVDRGEKPDRPEVEREHGHVAARERPEREEDRAIPAEHHSEVRVGFRVGAEMAALPR
jgi:hypothetical protein